MKTFKFERVNSEPVVLTVHDNPAEMVIDHLNQFQMHLMQGAELGSTLEDADRHFSKLDQLLAAGKVNEARRERENMRYGTYFMLQKLDLNSRALADLVVNFNNVAFTRDEEGLLDLGRQLSATLTVGERDEVIDHIRLKFGGR
jgi:hypothetical protein